jgi:hypothetical protein
MQMLSRRIRQANTLAMSQEGLSMHALRLIYSVVAQLSPDQEQFARVEIPLTEMQGILQVNQKNVYRDAKKAALELLNQTILLGDDDNGWVAFQWASESRYIPAKRHPNGYSAIAIQLHENLKPFLLQLKSHFNSFPQHILYEFSSEAVFKFFQLIWFGSHSGKRRTIEYELTEFRKRLSIEQKYTDTSDFNKFLRTLLDQVNCSKLGLTVDVEKLGRPIHSLRFNVDLKEAPENIVSEAEKELITELKKLGFFQPLDAIGRYGIKHVEYCLGETYRIVREAKAKTPIENPGALLHSLLKKEIEVELFEPEQDASRQELLLELIDLISRDFEAEVEKQVFEIWAGLKPGKQREIEANILAKANRIIAAQIERSGWTSAIGRNSIRSYIRKTMTERLDACLSIRKFALLQGYTYEKDLFEEAIVILEQTYG